MTSYYDIDAILTDAQKVPCTLNLDLPGLGYLDDNAGGDVCFHFQNPHVKFFDVLPPQFLTNSSLAQKRIYHNPTVLAL